MKIKFTLLILFLISGFLNSQIINIPDPVFKNKLIEEGVDANNDGEILADHQLDKNTEYRNQERCSPTALPKAGLLY